MRRAPLRSLVPLCALVGALLAPSPAAFAVTFTGLGALPGGTTSLAFALSADGTTVVGTSSSTEGTQAFRWTAGGGMTGLGDLGGGTFFSQALGVSDDGSVVVGESNSGNGREAFRWTAGGGLTPLGDLADGGFFSQARGVSGDGLVVVGNGTSSSGIEAFRWTAGGGLVGLGDLDGGSFESLAHATNADGSVVVGYGTEGVGSDREAFRWTASGMVGIGPAVAVDPLSEAFDVSADGSVVVGGMSDIASPPQAFRWTAATGMVGLGDLPGGDVDSVALAVSSDGQFVVGRSDGGTNDDAFLWDAAHGMRSVRDVLVDGFGLDLTGWELFEAVGISDDGRTLAGWGRHDGLNEAWIATIPEPSSGALTALGLLALVLARRARRRAGALAGLGLALGLAAPPVSAQPVGEWLAGDLHVHSTYSHDSFGPPDDDNTGPDEFFTLGHTVESQFTLAASRGLDYLAISDHNDIRSQSDPGFGALGVIPLPSYENSLRGHTNMHGAALLYDNGDASIERVRELAEELRADGGVFQINHPAGESTDFPHDADWQYHRDGGYPGDVVPDLVEVLNISSAWQPPFPSSNSIDDAVRYWEGWLDRGHRVGASGGSDNHWVSTTGVQGVGQPTTWVFAEERSAAGVLEGLRRGRTFVSFQPPAFSGPQLFLEADANRDGLFEAVVGDEVPGGARWRVRVIGAPGALLRVVVDGGRLAFPEIAVIGPIFEHRFDAPLDASWVRAEVVSEDLDPEREAVCDGLVGDQSTLCRNTLALMALTSALYQVP